MELKDTVTSMCSDDYKERFIAEYVQLKVRIKKLRKFIGKIMYAKYADMPEPKHDCPVDLLKSQVMAMEIYASILERRAEKYENIELPKDEEDD